MTRLLPQKPSFPKGGARTPRAYGAALLALALAVPAAAQAPVAPPFVERPESELLLLALRLGRDVLVDTLPAYPVPGGVLVPFGEVARLLELPIRIDIAGGLAEGAPGPGSRAFRLDARRGRVVVEGRDHALGPAEAEVHADDLYVHTSALSRWLPIDFDLDLRAAALVVRPREPLPVERRRERQMKAQQVLAAARAGGPAYPRSRLPYRPFAGPFADVSLLAGREPGEEAAKLGLQHTAYLSAEVLFMEASLRVAGNEEDPLDHVRGTVGRRDPDGRLLGPLRAREALTGEVFHPGLDLIALPRSGPGILLGNFPLQRQAQFDRHSFQGELPVGWEVELYRNDELVGYQQSSADGRYQFDDVPLFFGLNVFRLVFYGPQGQQRTETQRFNVGETLTPPGRLHYRLLANRPEEGGERASAELDVGIAPWLSAGLAGAEVDMPELGRRRYGKASLRGYWGWMFAHADVARDDLGGSLWQGGLQTRIGPLGLSLRHAALDRFTSERFVPQFGAIRSRSAARVDGILPRTFLPRMPVTAEAVRDRLASGGVRDTVSQRLSMFHRGFAVTNELNWTAVEEADGGRRSQARGNVLLSRFLQRLAVRGEVDYDIRPTAGVTTVALTAESRALRNYLLSAGVSRLLRAGQTRYLLGLSKNAGNIGLGVKADLARPGGLTLSASLMLSVGREPATGRWHADARAMAPSGAATARAFLDANDNGRRDPGELPLEGVGFAVNRALLPASTGPDGTLFAPHLPPHQDVEVSIVSSTLEDPLWGVRREGVRLVARPGRVATIDFPVIVRGEVVGTVYERRQGRTREAAGLDVELVDAAGRVVLKTRTAFDGFYDLAGVPPGRYALRVADARLSERGLTPPPPREVVIEPSGTILESVDVVLFGPEPAPSVADVPAAAPVAGSSTTAGRPALPAAVLPDAPQPAPLPDERLPRPAPPSGDQSAAREHVEGQVARMRERAAASCDGAPQSPAGEAAYAVQHSAFRDPQAAEVEANRLARELACPTRTVSTQRSAEGTFHRVLIGRFVTAAEAHRFKRALEARDGREAGPVHRLFPEASRAVASMTSRDWTQGPAWVLQMAAHRERAEAERVAARIARESGRPVLVVAANIPKRGLWHRVVLGGFVTAGEAHAHRERLRAGGSDVGPVWRIEPDRSH